MVSFPHALTQVIPLRMAIARLVDPELVGGEIRPQEFCTELDISREKLRQTARSAGVRKLYRGGVYTPEEQLKIREKLGRGAVD